MSYQVAPKNGLVIDHKSNLFFGKSNHKKFQLRKLPNKSFIVCRIGKPIPASAFGCPLTDL